MREVALTGDRPTGALHLGHYVGSLRRRVAMQDEANLHVLVADVQASTDKGDDPAMIRRNVVEVMADYAAVGLDPRKCTFVLQSAVPALFELTVMFLNLVTMERLQRNPTVKAETRSRGFRHGVPAGFAVYPASQAADILGFRATRVPVGADQAPMIEQAREIAAKVNDRAGRAVLPLPEALYERVSRLPGVDGGAKMSKSLGNAIPLSASDADIAKAVKAMYTDDQHLRIGDPGRIEGNVVFAYLDAFDPDAEALEGLKAHYRRGGLGDGALKQRLTGLMQAEIGPIRERRARIALETGDLVDALRDGTRRARETTARTLAEVRDALGVMSL